MRHVTELPVWKAWRDPVSGVESRLLDTSAAPLIQSFYFTNPSATPDGRFLWFYAAFPPAGDSMHGRLLGVVDAEDAAVRVFPETAFLDASPWVEPETGRIYWVTGLEIWRRGPKPEDRPERVNAFPSDFARNRPAERIATHLSRSADGKAFAVDARFGNEWFVGEAPLDGSPVRIWQTFDRCHNHAQFSPTDPDLMLLAQDWWNDANNGAAGKIQNRMWLLRRGESARPILPDGSGKQVHEWWDAGGRCVWYVDYRCGTHRVNPGTGEKTCVWPAATCHSHADASGRLLVADIGPYQWEKGCRVAFYNVASGREVNIVSSLPLPPMGRAKYHIDPHPQFVMEDRWIAYTTTVDGRVTLALTEVAALVEGTRS
jgi:hypothetical protein